MYTNAEMLFIAITVYILFIYYVECSELKSTKVFLRCFAILFEPVAGWEINGVIIAAPGQWYLIRFWVES